MRSNVDTSGIDWGVAVEAQAGQTECGDAWLIERVDKGFLAAVIDGLGHGAAAADASRRAVEAIRQSASLPLETIFSNCHQALTRSRGAAISVARIDASGQTLTWCGVGNVEGFVLNPVGFNPPAWQSEALLARGGVVGYELPKLHPVTLPFRAGACLLFATDGIRPGFASAMRAGQTAQQVADQILAGFSRGTDDALAMVVQMLQGGSSQNS